MTERKHGPVSENYSASGICHFIANFIKSLFLETEIMTSFQFNVIIFLLHIIGSEIS